MWKLILILSVAYVVLLTACSAGAQRAYKAMPAPWVDRDAESSAI